MERHLLANKRATEDDGTTDDDQHGPGTWRLVGWVGGWVGWVGGWVGGRRDVPLSESQAPLKSLPYLTPPTVWEKARVCMLFFGFVWGGWVVSQGPRCCRADASTRSVVCKGRSHAPPTHTIQPPPRTHINHVKRPVHTHNVPHPPPVHSVTAVLAGPILLPTLSLPSPPSNPHAHTYRATWRRRAGPIMIGEMWVAVWCGVKGKREGEQESQQGTGGCFCIGIWRRWLGPAQVWMWAREPAQGWRGAW